MKIALPIWNGRISPLFDTARDLLVIEAQDGMEIARSRQALDGSLLPQRAARLAERRVEVLLCGAISRPMAGMLAASGIKVVPFVAGDVEEVVAAYLAGRFQEQRFAMPGCCGRGFRFRGSRWHGQGIHKRG